MLPFSRQSIDKKDISSVIKVLKSNFITQGPKVIEFENKISKFVKSKFAIASNSGTSSLHLACLAIGIKKGDIVWTVPNTFAASANCAINCGASIDFVDINKDTWNMDINELEKKLYISKKKKNYLKLLFLFTLPVNQQTKKKSGFYQKNIILK